MILSTPTTLADAAKILLAKKLMPTALDTAGIRDLAASLRRQSLFSAQTLNQYLLDKYRTGISTLLAGRSNQATERLDVKGFLKSIGLEPSGPNGELTDLASDARIN